MGILDIFKKKPSQDDAMSNEKAPAHGWNAITSAFEGIYPGQTNPLHRAPVVYRMHDASENAAAFDGISAYDAGDYWHLVTFGLTELYEKADEDSELSGFGYEFTFKVPRVANSPAAWAFDFLEAIGRQVWRGQSFAAGHTIRTGPLDGRSTTTKTAVLVVRDPSFPQPLETRNGRVEFLLLVGVEDELRRRVLAAQQNDRVEVVQSEPILAELRAKDPRLVTPILTPGEWGKQ